jgi:predicted dehydrogenase
MRADEPFGLGLLGCGAFGVFCLEALRHLPEVRLVAAARATRAPARAACEALGVRVLPTYRDVIDRADVHVVHVATPPATHPELALQALRAGKHVLCEKPPALRRADAEEMVRAAERAGRFLATNFVMRYSPVAAAVRRVLETGALGGVLAAGLCNCASDSGLGADHWFWDKAVSGGIFLEHAVHFFDLYESWLGPGQVVSARAERREGDGLEDRAACTVRHAPSGADSAAGPAVLVTHYHGFDQVAVLDRTEHRLVCELGDVRVEGWLPQRLTVDAAVDEAALRALCDCLPGASVDELARYDGAAPGVLGRGKVRSVARRVRLRWERDPGHRRLVTERSGPAALAYAETAARLAEDAPPTAGNRPPREG